MLPLLIDVGIIQISSFGVFMALAVVVLSFGVWRQLRDSGIEDERIFDHLIVVLVSALLSARVFFVLTHWNLFSANLLRILVIWGFPGLSFWGGLIGGILALYIYAQRQKIPVPLVADAYAKAMPAAFIFGGLAIFLDGTLVGRETNLFLGMPVPGQVGKRHPVGLYGVLFSLIAILVLALIHWKIPKKQHIKGVFGWGMLSFVGLFQLLLAFFRSDLLYWRGIAVDQVVATILFIMPLVPIYQLLNGKRFIAQVLARVRKKT